MDSDLPASIRRSETLYTASVAVEGLLANPGDWRNIQDIIRVTFKALADSVKRQEMQLADLQRRHEDAYTALAASLEHKVSEPELLSSLSDLERRVSVKTEVEALQSALSEKLGVEDVQAMIKSKASMEEVARLLEQKAQKWDTEASLQDLESRFGEMTEELAQKLSTCALRHDLEAFAQTLDTKASVTQLEEGLSKKANSDTVASFLRKKANREEVEASLSRKADLTLVKDLVSAIESKADQAWVEQLAAIVDSKADTKEIAEKLWPEVEAKAARSDLDEVVSRVKDVKSASDRKHQELARLIEAKANVTGKEIDGLKSALEKVHSTAESAKAGVEKAAGRKADIRDLDNLAILVGKKADLDYMSEVVAGAKDEMMERADAHFSALQSQRDRSIDELLAQIDQLKSLHSSLSSEIQRLSDAQTYAEAHRQKESSDTVALVHSVTANLNSDIVAESQRLRQDLSVVLQEIDVIAKAKVDKADFEELRESALRGIGSKPDSSYIDGELAKAQQMLIGSLQSLKEDMRKKLNSIEKGLQKQVEQRVATEHFQSTVEQIITEQTRLAKSLSAKLDQAAIDTLIASISDLRADLSKKATQTDLSLHVSVLKSALDEASKDIAAKANSQEMCSLIDSKANVDDVNAALKSLHEATAQKVSVDEFREYMKAESQVLEGIVGRCLEARWTWNSGELRANGLVPWEAQQVNNAPDMLVWERGKPTILVSSPGLFEVSFAFFSRKKPSIQLLVNSEVVLSTSGSQCSVPRKGAPISGLSLLEFLQLPARARVTVAFSGESVGEGFLALRKV